MKNKIEVLKRLLILADYFKEKLSSTSQELYIRALDRYSDDQIFKAIEESMFLQYFPRLHAFQQIIEGSSDDGALKAWQDVLAEIDRVGVTKARFDEATTRAIDACGGVTDLGHTPSDKLTFKCKDFINNYKVISKRVEHKAVEDTRLKELTSTIKELPSG